MSTISNIIRYRWTTTSLLYTVVQVFQKQDSTEMRCICTSWSPRKRSKKPILRLITRRTPYLLVKWWSPPNETQNLDHGKLFCPQQNKILVCNSTNFLTTSFKLMQKELKSCMHPQIKSRIRNTSGRTDRHVSIMLLELLLPKYWKKKKDAWSQKISKFSEELFLYFDCRLPHNGRHKQICYLWSTSMLMESLESALSWGRAVRPSYD